MLALASLSVSALADVVPEQKAAQTAAAFFGSKQVQMTPKAVSGVQAAAPAFRAYNRDGGGFVVISGNDAVEPVLAYSETGAFPSIDQMPENMAWWFAKITKMIESIPETAKADAAVQARWANPGIPKTSSEMLLETALWGQGTPFNDKCPEVGGERCVTGCVATAAAILARYFKWPDAGVGTIPAFHDYGAGFDAHDLGHAYDWDNMPLIYYSGYTEAQADAVSTLMYDMGTMSRMDYGVNGSGAYTSDLLSALKTHMKYNKGAYLADRSDYSDAEWTALMKQQLEDCGPIAYSGSDVGGAGGHQFIIDGYDSQDRFHFNWGWNGGGNCYCWFTSLTPQYSSYDFANGQDALIDLVPDKDGTSTYVDKVVFYGQGDYYGIKASTSSFNRNTHFNCTAGWLYPIATSFNGSFYFALYDKDGNFKEDISDGYYLNIPEGWLGYFYMDCVIKSVITPGDRIKVRYVGQYNEGIVSMGSGCTTEIIVMPEDYQDPSSGYTAAQTAAATSLSYNKTTHVLSLTCLHPAVWSLRSDNAGVLASDYADEGQRVDINLSSYPSGTYTIAIGSSEDPYTFTITK